MNKEKLEEKIKFVPPFYPQNWDLRQWKELGFDSCEEADYWMWSSCGILCLKMAVDGFGQYRNKKELSPSIAEYIKLGVGEGGYTHKDGWKHFGLAKLGERFGLEGKIADKISEKEMIKILENNGLIIVSIKAGFKTQKTLKERVLFWKKYGGHLALVIGYALKNGKLHGFFVHHTAIKADKNWSRRLIDKEKFWQSFTGRGIIFTLRREL